MPADDMQSGTGGYRYLKILPALISKSVSFRHWQRPMAIHHVSERAWRQFGFIAYSLYGTNRWYGLAHYRRENLISGGDQNLSENILHFVLARTGPAEKGLAALSLFAARNYMTVRQWGKNLRVEEKLGIHASPTCHMRFDKARPS